MRLRATGLTLVVTSALLITACAGPGAASPTAGRPSPTAAAASPTAAAASPTAAAASPTAAAASPTGAAGTPVGSPAVELRIAVVTDVGTVNDKNFNEYTYVGSVNGAAAVGADEPPVFVPPDASQYRAGIDSFIETDYNVIVAAGFNLEAETVVAAKENPEIWFVGVDHNPCVDENGDPDPTFANCQPVADVIPNYILLNYQEDQAGYLAGIVAASISENATIGAIGGITLCSPCVRYIQGYELGAQSINPDITVNTAYVTESDFTLAFNDPVAGKSFGEQFIQQNSPDVLFQVAGKTGNGVLDAACDAGIHGIGVDVDQALSYPDAAACIVTSAEKKLALSVEQTIVELSQGTQTSGNNLWNAANDGIGISDFHDKADLITAETQTAIDTALQGMKDGTLTTCPETCGVYAP
jgi:basic membrane protein A and related proteins